MMVIESFHYTEARKRAGVILAWSISLFVVCYFLGMYLFSLLDGILLWVLVILWILPFGLNQVLFVFLAAVTILWLRIKKKRQMKPQA